MQNNTGKYFILVTAIVGGFFEAFFGSFFQNILMTKTDPLVTISTTTVEAQIQAEEARLAELHRQEVTAEERLLASKRQLLIAQAATKQAETENLRAIESKKAAELAQQLATVRLNDISLQQKTAETNLTNLQIELDTIKTELEAAKKQLAAITPLPQPTPKATASLIANRYQDNGDGTVTDVTTNLMWKRCTEGQTWNGETCVGETESMTWNAIMPDGEQKIWPAFAGYTDWRVPTREELKSLVYCSSGDPKIWNDIINKKDYNGCKGKYQRPTIDQQAFPNTPRWFWTATPYTDDCCSWIVYFGDGSIGYNGRTNSYFVRGVRAGQ